MVERLLWEENARVEEKLRAANLTWSDVARQRELAQRAKPVDIGEPESVARVELEQKATARIRAASD